MKATHWKIKISRPDPYVQVPAARSWYVMSKLRDVYNGLAETTTYLVLTEATANNHKAAATKWGLIAEIIPCVLVELTAEELLDEGVPVPIKDEWPILVERYATEWFGEISESA